MTSLPRRLAICSIVLAFSTLLVVGDEPQRPKEVAAVYTGHAEAVYGVAISPDGKQLLTGSFDRTIKLWELASAK
jgi:WD40 repeat protein